MFTKGPKENSKADKIADIKEMKMAKKAPVKAVAPAKRFNRYVK